MSKDFIDLRQDTWAASDDLNRQLPLNVEVNKKDRKVGIFYFMWHRGKGELMDHSLAYAMGGIEEFEKVMQQGRLGFAHYWAEPYFGYYRSDDEWVIRKHVQMFVDAGIDFLVFDTTNACTYQKRFEQLLKVWYEYLEKGISVPKLAFYTNSASGRTMDSIYDNIYLSDHFPFNKAMKILDDYENRDGYYAFVCEKCASVFGYYGHFFYEKELKERAKAIYERN